MDTHHIIDFLTRVAENNTRAWFAEHKAEYDAVRADFERGVALAIDALAALDPALGRLSVKDCTYRFYRDTRFSPDKSPYKTHLGAYINARGRKALRGGYYMHLEPGHCLLAAGNYWLPTNVLNACRNEIMSNEERWLQVAANPEFVRLFGHPGEGDWDGGGKGFGLAMLKKCPAGFPKDYAHADFLRMKDYCAWHSVPAEFFDGDDWPARMVEILRVAKPMTDMMNAVIDDYES